MISPATLFSLCSTIALVAWLALALSLFVSRVRSWTWLVTGLAIPTVFAVVYLGSLVAGLAAGGGGGFGSIEDVRTLFANDHALTAGWIHYLAFDLIVGTLIARDGARLGLNPLFVLPSLVLTFLFGPTGLLLHLVIRASSGASFKEALS